MLSANSLPRQQKLGGSAEASHSWMQRQAKAGEQETYVVLATCRPPPAGAPLLRTIAHTQSLQRGTLKGEEVKGQEGQAEGWPPARGAMLS